MKDLEIGRPINSGQRSETADGVARESPPPPPDGVKVLSESRMREICMSVR